MRNHPFLPPNLGEDVSYFFQASNKEIQVRIARFVHGDFCFPDPKSDSKKSTEKPALRVFFS